MRVLRIVGLAATLMCWAETGQAATITLFNRATFDAAVTGGTVSSQDFDGLANGALLTTLDGVMYGASLGSPRVTNSFLTSTPPNGLGSTSIGFFQSNETATFTFGSAITAFGIDINTFANTENAYSGTLNIGDVALSKFDVFPGQATGQFLGFTSDTPFTSVTIQALSGFSYTLDTLVWGAAGAIDTSGETTGNETTGGETTSGETTGGGGEVPEPATLTLVGLGLAGLARGLSQRR